MNEDAVKRDMESLMESALKGKGGLLGGTDFQEYPVFLQLQKGSVGGAFTNLGVYDPLDERSGSLCLDVVDIGSKE